VKLSGSSTAPPAPCTIRATISASVLPASAAAAEATVKTRMPTTYIRRRPYRSPSAAPVSMRQANTRL
jgi:hypothetical protein